VSSGVLAMALLAAKCGEELRLQRRGGHLGRQRPAQPGGGKPPQGQPNGRRGHTEPSCRTHLRSLTEALRALGASASSLLARRANDDDQQSNTIASRCIV